MMNLHSPLRYPGGKACLKRFLSDVIELNDLRGCTYYEPYAGGAGAALGLLQSGIVSKIFINDLDFRVNAFWNSVLNHNDRFVDRVLSVPLDITEWTKQRDICSKPRRHKRFDVGFAAFYMNRCNRSGVLTGAGPIGGHKQDGKWRLGVRFSREPLAQRLLALSRLKDKIHLTRLDALAFLKKYLPKGREREKVFVYLDPPYVSKGQRLYLNAYGETDHSHLARYMQAQTVLSWIMSYDDASLIRKLYRSQKIACLPIRYSLQEKRSALELVIAPRHLDLPSICRINGKESSVEVKTESMSRS